ncbi:serine protease [Methylobacillus flagellatus]|uniref:serine protease n=1 Tax=Methylobacillus flagellatus TaxID=405 RepID=UPI0010F95E89|nr:serine protease [Methylobacillus flagellatus]
MLSSLSLSLLLPPLTAQAQPTREELFAMFASVVQVTVTFPDGSTGTGSGVVIEGDHVATNCHVLANANGANITKLQQAYTPIGLKADWKHDLCLLKFDGLPMKPMPLRDTASLQYEEPVFVLSYPGDNPVPQPSFGSVKALYPYDGSVILRSDASFALGSSGGALFDQNKHLIGITTFKSPGRGSYFYNLPVEWIRKLLDAPETRKLATTEMPFWSLPELERPFFMQVVIPFQKKDWATVEQIAQTWHAKEPANIDALYYLGSAQRGLKKLDEARTTFTSVITQNPRHLDAMSGLAEIALSNGDKAEALRMAALMQPLDSYEAETLEKRISALP